MPKDFGDMMQAVNALNDKCRELVALAATVTITAAVLAGAAAAGLVALERGTNCLFDTATA